MSPVTFGRKVSFQKKFKCLLCHCSDPLFVFSVAVTVSKNQKTKTIAKAQEMQESRKERRNFRTAAETTFFDLISTEFFAVQIVSYFHVVVFFYLADTLEST